MTENIGTPELNSLHSVKVLICYILDRLGRSVTDEQLLEIAQESGVISYFYFSDALDELITNGSVISKETLSPDGNAVRQLTLTEKGRLGSEYFNRYIPLVFRRKLLKAAFSFFAALRREAASVCTVDECKSGGGCTVDFTLTDGDIRLISMSFYAPDIEQAQMIAQRIKANPEGAYRSILGYLLNNPDEKIDIDKYL